MLQKLKKKKKSMTEKISKQNREYQQKSLEMSRIICNV